MAFPSNKGSSNGLSNRMGNHHPADEKSNSKGSSGSGKTIGPISGRVKTVKGPSVSSLPKGCSTSRGKC